MAETYKDIEEVGNIPYGDLPIPGDYMIKDDTDLIHRISLMVETFSTVLVRKHKISSRSGEKYSDRYMNKADEVYVIEYLPSELEEEDEEQ